MKYFGTDGIRALTKKFTGKFLTEIALGIACLPDCARVIIARDPRIGGENMGDVLSKVFSDSGVEVLSAGMIPTPCLAYLTKFARCDYGIMLSASHNPPEYNGVKLFNREGGKVSRETESAVEKNIDDAAVPPARRLGAVIKYDGAENYLSFLLSTLKPDLGGIRVFLDAANGATSILAPELFRRAGAAVFCANTALDGASINKGCGATHREFLKSRAEGFDIGFAFDGDGDRAIAFEGDKIRDGDHIMYCHCRDLMSRGELSKNTMVGTVMTNMGTQIACNKHGITLVRTAVGDANVAMEMSRNGYIVGGEESGHIIFKKYMPTGDGLLSALLTAMLHKRTPLHVLDDITEYPSVSLAIVCDEKAKDKFRRDGEIKAYLDGVDDSVRVVVRPSGTEPVIRILAEAREESSARFTAESIKKFIEGRLL